MDPSQQKKDNYRVTGLMSGTSLDGVDIAFCTFSLKSGKWTYILEKAETIAYSNEWKTRLSNLENERAIEFVKTDAEYGHYLGKITKEFHQKHNLIPDFIASHGHTIFHRPERKFTSQIGDGSSIAAETGIPVVCDFRSADIALGGQGAPLVPIGDQFLFGNYDYCLNLGGFANISFKQSDDRIAFDICPVNVVLNHLASFLHKEYDEYGILARNGLLGNPLLEELNTLKYYSIPPPKSLGKEWVLKEVYPLIERFEIPVEDKLRTFTEHIAVQIANIVGTTSQSSMLITGGGTFNNFLIERIRERTGMNLILPDNLTINFKEALIFAFLGVLRWREEINCLKSCTGASHNNIGGAIYRVFSERGTNDL
jgi:anhydro-N-acetylmuramic acid kinase